MRHYHKNPRQITKKQLTDLDATLRELGDLSGIVHDLNSDETIGGNQRSHVFNINECEIELVDGPHEPDAQGTVAHGFVIWQGARYAYRQVRWTPEQCEKANVVANSAGGNWDWDILANEFEAPALIDWGFDADLLKDWKANVGALDNLLKSEKEAEDEGGEDPGDSTDRAEELQEKWQVSSGDVWKVGPHFVICGDCRDFNTWEKLLKAAGVERVHGVFTSPPYAEQRKEQYGGVPADEYVDWWEDVQANTRANIATDGSFFVNIKPHCENGERVLYVFDLVLAMRRRWEWRYIDELCWVRPAIPGNMGARFKNEFEPVYHFSVGEVKFRPNNVVETGADLSGMKTYDQTDGSVTLGKNYNGKGGGSVRSKNFDGALPGNVINVSRGFSENPGHGAVFPVALPDFFIRAFSDPGDVWLDPFCGSGTTIVAAHQNERRGLGIEYLPKYMAVILERLSQMGLEPVLISDG